MLSQAKDVFFFVTVLIVSLIVFNMSHAAEPQSSLIAVKMQAAPSETSPAKRYVA